MDVFDWLSCMADSLSPSPAPGHPSFRYGRFQQRQLFSLLHRNNPRSSDCSPPSLPLRRSYHTTFVTAEPPWLRPVVVPLKEVVPFQSNPVWCSTKSTNAGTRGGWETSQCREITVPLLHLTTLEFSSLEGLVPTGGPASFWLPGKCSGKRDQLFLWI